MNFMSVVVLIAAAFSATVSALPSPSSDQLRDETSLKTLEDSGVESTLDELLLEEETGEIGDRFRRVTCDILSVQTKWLSFNHAPCAIRCIAKRRGYRGGSCRGGVCFCRRRRRN